MPEQKDLVIATLGASSAIAGLILIFCGFLFAQAAIFPPETSDKTIQKFTRCGRLGVIPFMLSMAVTAISFYWLLHPGDSVFACNAVLFWATILLTVVYGSATILFLL